MRKCVVLLFAGLLVTQASAGILVYTDTMFGGNEVPPNGSRQGQGRKNSYKC